MHVETLSMVRVSHANAMAIAELLYSVWPRPDKPLAFRYHSVLNDWKDYDGPAERAPRSFIMREGGRVIAHAMILPRTLQSEEFRIPIMGLARVCCARDRRGHGLGQLVVQRAFAAVDALACFSLFQTTIPVRPFYEKLGAILVGNCFRDSTAPDPWAHPFWDDVIMRYPDRDGWPLGEIDLCGPAF